MSFKDFTTTNNADDDTPPSNGGVPTGASILGPQTQDTEDILIDYNKRFANAEATLFRDEVIAQTISVLIGKNKPNALLVGAAGVGKTRIVEDIARRIATNHPSIPPVLQGMTIYELPLASLVAGSSFVGQLEEKVQNLVAFAEDPDNKAIIFIDEIHQLANDRSQTYAKIAQILKPALARGDMRTIGATTLQEAQDLVDDPAFSRRFTRVIVDELTQEQTAQVLKNAWPSYVAHYNGQIQLKDEDTFELVTAIADQYATAIQHRPDSALTLLDRACADTIVAKNTSMAKMDPALAQAFAAQPMALTERRIRACAKKLATGMSEQAQVSADQLDEALSPIFGQDEALAKVKRLVLLSELNLFPRTKPITVLCAGPSGCGKSAVARIIADVLTDTEPITLNMTEYNSPASVNRIIGSPAGYVGSDSHAELPFDKLESNPYQVILLDEMEKCDRSVQRLFMSAFDDGYIKTAKGKTVDFSKCIIFVTTNASHTTAIKRSCGFTSSTTKSDIDVIDDLSNWFDVEFLNRFRTILSFNPISKDTYRTILADKYKRHIERIAREAPSLSFAAELDEDTLKKLSDKSYIPDFGARPAERTIQEYIEDTALAMSTN